MVLFFTHIPFMVNCAFQRNASGVVVTTSPPFYNETHRSHVLCVKAESNTTLHPGYSTILLRSESPSGMCAKLRTVAASNNRVHTPRSLYYCLFVPPIYGVVLRTHSVRGEPCISAQHQPSGCNRIITSKQQKSSKSDPVLIRQFKKKMQSDPVLIRAHLWFIYTRKSPLGVFGHAWVSSHLWRKIQDCVICWVGKAYCIAWKTTSITQLYQHVLQVADHVASSALAGTDSDWAQWRSQPKNWGTKMFDFRRIALFCLEKRLSRHKMTKFSNSFFGGMAPLCPLATPMIETLCPYFLGSNRRNRSDGKKLSIPSTSRTPAARHGV